MSTAPRSLVPLVVLVLATALTACDKEPSIGDLVDERSDLLGEQDQVACDCYAEWDYETRSACLGDSAILPSQRRCIEDALRRNESASRDWLECRIPLEREFLDCLDRKLACEDEYSIDPCYEDYEVGVAECVELPNTVERALEDC